MENNNGRREQACLFPINLKNLYLKSNIMLAPMAGVTDKYFRKIVRKFEKDSLIFTEMIHSIILVQSRKKQPITDITEEDHPISMQIFGHDPEYLAMAAKIAQDRGFDSVDINMACPAPKIVKNGDGSALLLNPALAEEIMKKVVASVSIPVTIKIRAGWDSTNIVAKDFAKIAEYCGISAVIFHARTRGQYYTGLANRNLIKEVQAAVKIPVIGNGDVWTPEDALAMLKQTDCKGVMIGRGALGNPWIIRQANDYLQNRTPLEIDIKKKFETAIEHLNLMAEGKGEKRGVVECRKHLLWYTKGLPYSSEMRKIINCLSVKEDILKIFNLIQ